MKDRLRKLLKEEVTRAMDRSGPTQSTFDRQGLWAAICHWPGSPSIKRQGLECLTYFLFNIYFFLFIL